MSATRRMMGRLGFQRECYCCKNGHNLRAEEKRAWAAEERRELDEVWREAVWDDGAAAKRLHLNRGEQP